MMKRRNPFISLLRRALNYPTVKLAIFKIDWGKIVKDRSLSLYLMDFSSLSLNKKGNEKK